MAIELDKKWFAEYATRMEKSIDHLQEELNTVRAGRANPRVLDRIEVDYYGTKTPINQIAAIQVPEPRQITITPWDPSSLKEIERAIQASDLGINPQNDGKMIRLTFPTLTEERRKDLVKQIQRLGEEAKVAVRNIRRDAMDKVKTHLKAREVGEDNAKDTEDKIQKQTDEYIARIDEVVADKEKDLMEI